jgi:hypothetical protein
MACVLLFQSMNSSPLAEVGNLMEHTPTAETYRRLSRPDAFPGDPAAVAGVDWIQTHLSHVYLTRDRVYKFRKPVDFGFVRFAARAARNADCQREVELNRRLSPDVYLGVAALSEADGRCGVGPVSDALPANATAEYCVVMRRLPEGRDALSLLEGDALSAEMLDRVARRLTRFHDEQNLGIPAPFSATQWLERTVGPVETCFEVISKLPVGVEPDALNAARDRVQQFVQSKAERFEQRRLEGRAVDAHGDLHLQHIWFEDDAAGPTIIDCLEFDAALREIDVASEVAFLVMDLRYRGRQSLAESFLRNYAAHSGDFGLYRVVDYFISYRAAVRAKVAALAAADAAIDPGQRQRAETSASNHLELAAQALSPRPPGSLWVVCGIVGSGKSSAARVLADRVDGVIVASDRIRKKLAGLESGVAGDEVDTGLYAPKCVDAVYASLLEQARPVVESGRDAILDATFSSRAHRTSAAEWARSLGIPVRFMEVRCAPGVAIERLRARAAAGRDDSDAGPDFHAVSAARWESPLAEGFVHVIRTDAEGWRERLAAAVGDFG